MEVGLPQTPQSRYPRYRAIRTLRSPWRAGGSPPPGGGGGRADGGAKIEETKLVTMGSGLHVTTGPAAVYWNAANTASGNYTVKATFSEREYMGLNDHAHPYGIVIGGNDMG